MGGRQIICSMLWNHRLSLNNMEDKSPLSPLQTKLHTPRQGCYTDRGQSSKNPPLFFRRLPTTNYQKYKELLYQKPLSFPKPPKSKGIAHVLIDWNKVQQQLQSHGQDFYKLNLQTYLEKLTSAHKLTKQYDFATLIEIMLQLYPKLS